LQFDFIICYKPGSQGQKPDAFTRRSQDLPASADNPRITYQNHVLLCQENLDVNIKNKLHAVPIVIEPELEPTDYKITRLLETRYISNKF
jgi:hypothetical protein